MHLPFVEAQRAQIGDAGFGDQAQDVVARPQKGDAEGLTDLLEHWLGQGMLAHQLPHAQDTCNPAFDRLDDQPRVGICSTYLRPNRDVTSL